ncbi:MAG TPA: hypothetical protein DCZ01_03240 [Elusimicrobia bacterium]|nr:MAG: hypothetical protein A2X37_08070 [Elusimicrobia bacterium GWA2_66_18]OGR72833.1 MAG: hypothetical protein A2X40_07790 [Elusimicrobia bacterium GWC2_65_9]HAZ07546.1 hypothetical protein [Elusimicrobiota bacterium]
MKRSLPVAAALLAGACALGRVDPGTSDKGEVIRVNSREITAARRAALEAVLPLFLTEEARRREVPVIEEQVFARSARLIGRERLGASQEPVVEVRLDALAAALEHAGLLRPAGFTDGPSKVLLALAESEGGYGVGPAADSLRRALVARGIAAADARDPLNASRFKAKTPDQAVAEAAAGGVDWLVLGRTGAVVEPDEQAGAWRAVARLETGLYATKGSTQPVAVSARSSSVDVSSPAASGRALEQAGEEVAARVASLIERSRAGRAEYSVLVLPPRDAGKIRALVADLRRVDGVSAACLGAWRGPEGAAVVRVFASGMGIDDLGARLLRRDASLRLVGVEPDSGCLTIETAMDWGD